MSHAILKVAQPTAFKTMEEAEAHMRNLKDAAKVAGGELQHFRVVKKFADGTSGEVETIEPGEVV